MRFISAFLAFLTLLLGSTVVGIPTALKTVERYAGVKVPGKYIVTFKSGASRKDWIKKLGKPACSASWDSINGIAVKADESQLNTLLASADVESVSEDGIMSIFGTQTDASWGLQRISQAARLSNMNSGALNFVYTYHDSAGAGVDIYIVDTGVNVNHTQFGGRARWGVSFVGTSTDGHGHGTHIAGIAAGSQFGVAKRANIIAVQVLNSSGSGTTSGVISGLDWVLSQFRATGRPSIVSLSLGGAVNSALDNAVTTLTSNEVHVVVAAGNSNVDAINTSPARVPSAITVGATAIDDTKASFSNYGSIIDVWAPGVNIISSWIGSNTATNSISGTSMATPFVTGTVALFLSAEGEYCPIQSQLRIKEASLPNVLAGIPAGSANRLLQIPKPA